MNVRGYSYGHVCPDCDPNDKIHHMTGHSHIGSKVHEHPKFGPDRETIISATALYRSSPDWSTKSYDYPIPSPTSLETAVEFETETRKRRDNILGSFFN